MEPPGRPAADPLGRPPLEVALLRDEDVPGVAVVPRRPFHRGQPLVRTGPVDGGVPPDQVQPLLPGGRAERAEAEPVELDRPRVRAADRFRADDVGGEEDRALDDGVLQAQEGPFAGVGEFGAEETQLAGDVRADQLDGRIVPGTGGPDPVQ
ncbi:hypothetical protein [Amycolatopsis sp. NPDC049159]|uniref:hypothetical protein n=1 Tax=Amycolatopsis sp. NPDC049159 TaxID=3157210 RepID=UPI0033EB5B1E